MSNITSAISQKEMQEPLALVRQLLWTLHLLVLSIRNDQSPIENPPCFTALCIARLSCKHTRYSGTNGLSTNLSYPPDLLSGFRGISRIDSDTEHDSRQMLSLLTFRGPAKSFLRSDPPPNHPKKKPIKILSLSFHHSRHRILPSVHANSLLP